MAYPAGFGTAAGLAGGSLDFPRLLELWRREKLGHRGRVHLSACVCVRMY